MRISASGFALRDLGSTNGTFIGKVRIRDAVLLERTKILVGRSDAMEAADRFGPAYVGLPFTILISPDRQILYTHSGELHREQLENILSVIDELAAGAVSVAEARARLAR